MEQSEQMALERMKWLKFRVTESQYQDAKIAFARSKERWFWRWCQKMFYGAVKQSEEIATSKEIAKRFQPPK